MLKANYHTHTYLCGHAIGDVSDYVNEAIQRTPNDLKLHLAKIKLGKLT